MLRRILILSLVFWGIVSVAFVARADDLEEISKNIASTPDQVSKGQGIYTTNCASCHGAQGKGDGPAAAAFNPKPRNFSAEKFKQGASPSGVFNTVTNGLGSMPAFGATLSVADRLAVTHYVLSLTPGAEKDTPESMAKIGLDPTGKPLAGFKGAAEALPVEFIIERMATDGDINKIDYAALSQRIAQEKAEAKAAEEAKIIKPDLARGKYVFDYCADCHGNNAEGDDVIKTPQLAGQDVDYLITQLRHFQNGARGAHPDDVYGLRMRPMSRMLRNEKDLLSVAHYIAQLKPEEPEATMKGDPAKGQAAYAVCMACHGPDAQGSKAMKAPSLRHLQDWYLARQIESFKKGYRGTDPRDTNGATMRGMSMALTEESVKDVISYIRTLK